MEELLDGVLGPVDPQRFRCWHLLVRGEAETSFPAGDDLAEEEAERLRLRQVGQPGLIVVLDVDKWIIDAEPFRQFPSLVQTILDRLGFGQQAFRLPEAGPQMVLPQLLGEEVVVDPAGEYLLQSIDASVSVYALPAGLGELFEVLVITFIQFLGGQVVVAVQLDPF